MKRAKPMTNVVSALTARTQLGQILRRAKQKNERFVIDRRGEPMAVIISVKDYVEALAPAPNELRAMQQQAKRVGTNRLTMRQIDDIIAEVRRSEARKANKRRAS